MRWSEVDLCPYIGLLLLVRSTDARHGINGLSGPDGRQWLYGPRKFYRQSGFVI